MDSGHIVLSAIQPETIANRLNHDDEDEDEIEEPTPEETK